MDTFAQASTARQALTAGSILSLTLLIICSIRCLLFFTSIHSRATGRQPPTLPYIIPVVGSALTYITNPFKFVTTAGSVVPLSQPNHKLTPCSTDPNHPIRIKLLARDVVLVRGHANIQRLWRQTRLTTSTALFSFMLHTLFGMRWQAARRAFPLGAGLGPLVGRFAGEAGRPAAGEPGCHVLAGVSATESGVSGAVLAVWRGCCGVLQGLAAVLECRGRMRSGIG